MAAIALLVGIPENGRRYNCLPPVKRLLAAGLLPSRYVNILLDQLTGK